MANTFALTPQRIGQYNGMILKHSRPEEYLVRQGQQHALPQNKGEVIKFRRWEPTYGDPDGTNKATFFADGTGDRAQAIVNRNLASDGVTPAPESITPFDISVSMRRYSCLYGITKSIADLHEDKVADEMMMQTGRRVGFVNEMICYSALKGCSSQYYGGTATTFGTVNGGLTRELLSTVRRGLRANHARMVKSELRASADYNTQAVEPAYCVFAHTDMESDIRALPGFVPCVRYSQMAGKDSGMHYGQGELGTWESFRFVISPELVEHQDAGASVGSLGLKSTSGSKIDVYRLVVLAEESFGQVYLRGKASYDPTMIPVDAKDKSDPTAERGYVGASWYKVAFPQNDQWMGIINVGASK